MEISGRLYLQQLLITNQVLKQQNAIGPNRYTKTRFSKIDKHAFWKQLYTIKDQRIANYESK